MVNVSDPKISILNTWGNNFLNKDLILLKNYLHFVILSSYYQVLITNFFTLKKSTQISNFEKNFLKKLNFDMAAFKFGFQEFYYRSFIYKLYLILIIISKKITKKYVV